MLENYSDIINDDEGHLINENVLKVFLKDHSFNVPKEKKDITDSVKGEVENILGKDNPLTELILYLLYYNFICVDIDGTGNYTREKELKVYNIDKVDDKKDKDYISKDELIDKINTNLPSEPLYKAKISDIYYDFADLSLRDGKYTEKKEKTIVEGEEGLGLKSSIRTRKKEIISQVVDGKNIAGNGAIMHYCTIKKENPDNESEILKDVYEFEFLLTNPIIFSDLIRLMGLGVYKTKVKYRDSFKYGSMTLDLDDYVIDDNNVKKIDDDGEDLEKIVVLEVETAKESYLDGLFTSLGIDDHEKYPKSKDGFGKMFKNFNYKINKLIKKK